MHARGMEILGLGIERLHRASRSTPRARWDEDSPLWGSATYCEVARHARDLPYGRRTPTARTGGWSCKRSEAPASPSMPCSLEASLTIVGSDSLLMKRRKQVARGDSGAIIRGGQAVARGPHLSENCPRRGNSGPLLPFLTKNTT